MPDVLLFLTAAEASLEPGGFNLRSAAVGAKQAPPAPGAPSSAAKSNRLVPVLFFSFSHPGNLCYSLSL